MAATQDLINKVLGDAARPTKFAANIFLPPISGVIQPEPISVMVKNTVVPSRKSDPVNFMLQGKPIPIRGQTKYDQQIDVTFHLEENHRFRNQLDNWMEANDYNGYQEKVPEESMLFANMGTEYRGNIVLTQYDFNYIDAMVDYYLFNVFPINISTIEYNSEGLGQLVEVTVTFAYSHYEMVILKDNVISESGDFGYLKLPESKGTSMDIKPQTPTSGGFLSDALDSVLSMIGFSSAKETMSSGLGALESKASSIGSMTGGALGGGVSTYNSSMSSAEKMIKDAAKISNQVSDLQSKQKTGTLSSYAASSGLGAVGISTSRVTSLKSDAAKLLKSFS